MLIIFLWLKNYTERVIKLLNLKLVIGSELLSIGIFLARVTLKICQKKYSNPSTYKIKDLNGGKIIGIFYEE